MPRLYLVRHGRAAGGWTEDTDPGLDTEGSEQAEKMAAELVARVEGPLTLVCSPLRRTLLTVAPLERLWSASARVEPRVGEIPSPVGEDGELANRGAWLAGVMSKSWDDESLGPVLLEWRSDLLSSLAEMEEDTVVVSHFVAINAAVGAATGDGRVVGFRPDYCSVTVLDSDGSAGGLTLVEQGRESATVVR